MPVLLPRQGAQLMPDVVVEMAHEVGLECEFESRPDTASEWSGAPATRLGEGVRYEVSQFSVSGLEEGHALRSHCTTDAEGCEGVGCTSDWGNVIHPVPEPSLGVSLLIGAVALALLHKVHSS